MKTFIGQLDILIPREGPAIELTVCTLLRESPMDVNRVLCSDGLDSWCIKQEEESTLCKIAILYQLALCCCDYSTEFRRMCRLLQAYVSN